VDVKRESKRPPLAAVPVSICTVEFCSESLRWKVKKIILDKIVHEILLFAVDKVHKVRQLQRYFDWFIYRAVIRLSCTRAPSKYPSSVRRLDASGFRVSVIPFFLFCIYYKLIRRELAAKPQLRVEKKKARRSLFDAAPTRRWSICESPKKKLFLFYFLSSVLACTCESAMVVWPARHHSWLGFSPDSTLARWYVSTLSILSRFFFSIHVFNASKVFSSWEKCGGKSLHEMSRKQNSTEGNCEQRIGSPRTVN
jgi:hypothetical protein